MTIVCHTLRHYSQEGGGKIGLNIEKPSAELYDILRDVTQSYGDELQTLVPLNVAAMVAGKQAVNFFFVRGLIESTDMCYGYVTEGTWTVPPGAPIQEQKTEGWRKLP